MAEVVRVLVVDDQETFARAMGAVVEETAGFDLVGSVGSGEQSVDAVATLHPDLVLMDVNMPGIDGLEATRRLCGLESPPIVVLLSTYDEDEFDIAGCGAASYVPKAMFGPDRLAAAWAGATS
ncbi:MAG: two-component system, NarL family, invasion response regulator UvrY [Nocardioidaceae bacterium]|nr:two-component system, NarL family, invasion response regulator UvrY [Nocardioidaceae bacterium]